jgi:hypothetical protein
VAVGRLVQEVGQRRDIEALPVAHAAGLYVGGMDEEVTVTRDGPRTFVVEVRGERAIRHLVEVPPSLVEDLGLGPDDGELLVRESFAFLLEREPATSIMTSFALDVIEQYFPEYRAEMGRRLS